MGVTRTRVTAVGIGQNTPIYGVTYSHGAVALPFGDSVDCTPKTTLKEQGAFGSKVSALLYNVHEGCTGKVSFGEGNQGLYEALVMDYDPNTEEIVVNPADYEPFSLMGTLKGLNREHVGGFLAVDCLAANFAKSRSLKDIGKGTLDFTGKIYYETRGLSIIYDRIRATNTAPSAVTTPALTAGTGGAGTLAAGAYYVCLAGYTAASSGNHTIASDEVGVVCAATGKISFTAPAADGILTHYAYYIGNRSGACRYVATVAGGASVEIDALPSATAPLAPLTQTAYAPQEGGTSSQATTDLVFSTKTATLSATAYPDSKTGLPYLAVFYNGKLIASPAIEATSDEFTFPAARTTFVVATTPAIGDWWDVFYLSQPT